MTFLPDFLVGEGASTPLMTALTYFLFFECGAIVFLSLPFHIKFRRSFSEWILTSPALKHTRTVFGTLFVCLGALLTDNILRLNRSQNKVAKDLFSAQLIYSQRARAQRDFFIISFTIFNALVLYQVQMMLLRMGRYRKERNMLVDQVRSLGAVPVEVAGMEGSKGGRVLGGARKKQ